MLVVRDVFQAKYGRGDELVALFKEARQKYPEFAKHHARVLTDASGPFFMVIQELQVENLADWEKMRDSIFQQPDFASWFARMIPLVESGRREILQYRVLSGAAPRQTTHLGDPVMGSSLWALWVRT